MDGAKLRIGLTEYLLLPQRAVRTIATPELARRLAEAALGPTVTEDDHRRLEQLALDLFEGRAVAVHLESEPRLLDPPRDEPLVPIKPDDPDPDRPARRTWISLEVVHEMGLALDGVQLTVEDADGREVFGSLGAGGRWRTDDVSRGSCELRFVDRQSLVQKKRIVGPPATRRDSDEVWRVGRTRRLRLAAGQHHRLFVTEPRQLRFSV